MLEDGIRRWNPWWVEREGIRLLSGIERNALKEILKTLSLPHIKDILGVRRSGKTTLLYQVINSLLDTGVKPKDIIFLNFDDPEINKASFEDILRSVGKINPNVNYLFVDEVQQKPGWEMWVRTIYDTKMFRQIFVSGSSASILSQDIGRVLTGRHLTFSISPFSFREYLGFIGWKRFDKDFLEYHKNKLLHHQQMYIKTGGFPETIGKTDAERTIILTNIYNDILSRDISARFGVSYDIVKNLGYHLLSNTANEFSYRSVANSTRLSVETVEKYLEFLKESFMVLTIGLFSYKTKIQFRQNKKIYCIDNGLRNTVSFRSSEDLGRLTENLVFIELKRRGKDVYYWKNKAGREVDFLVKEGLNVKQLIQVSWSIESQDTKQRELRGLLDGMRQFKLKQGFVITEDLEAEEVVGENRIIYLPLWKWLLDND